MSAAGGSKTGHRFEVLDAVRGLCAIAVVLFHMGAYTHWYWQPAVRNAYVAVDFFFVLSGFVIASAYRHKLAETADGLRFAVRRFGRLYPLHLMVLLVYVGLELMRLSWWHAGDAFTGNRSLPSLAEQLFLLQGFTAAHESWNYPAWSISVELWLNFAFAVLVVGLGRRFFLAAIVVLAMTGALDFYAGDFTWPVSDGAANALGDVVQSVFEFFLGFVAFSLFALTQRRGGRMPGWIELLTLGLVGWAFCAADNVPNLGLPWIFFAAVFVFAFESGPVSRLLRHPALVGLGTISYSVYLTHSLYLAAQKGIVSAIADVLRLPATSAINGELVLSLGGMWAMDAAAVLCVAAVIAGSTVTYRVIEEPARRYFNRLSNDVLPVAAIALERA